MRRCKNTIKRAAGQFKAHFKLIYPSTTSLYQYQSITAHVERFDEIPLCNIYRLAEQAVQTIARSA